MANAEEYNYEYFNVTFPAEYVAHVEIDRADKLNAFKEVMWQNLSTIFTRLSHSPAVRAILLTGAGPRAFTAGLDIQAASSTGPLSSSSPSDGPADPSRAATSIRRHILDFQSCISAVEHCEKPVVAVLHGICYGLALDLSLACDVRLASADAALAVKEVDIGIAADIGTLSRLPRAVGNASWVKDVCLSARVFGAREAERVGLVSGVYKDKGEAVKEGLGLACRIAEKSPVATAGTKEILNFSRDRSVADGLRYTAVWNMAMLQSADVGEAMGSVMQKRRPRFGKL